MEKTQLKDEIIRGMESLGYTSLLAVQKEVIPHILAGKNCLIQSETGSGKTAAYLVPVLNRLDPFSVRPQALIIAPTRELAVQIHETAAKLAAFAKIHCVCVIGGLNQDKQENALKHYPALVIGTPGRLADLYRQNLIDFRDLKCLVLDEADQIASTGQADELSFLLNNIEETQTVCVSATVNDSVLSVFSNEYDEFIFSSSDKVSSGIREYYLITADKNQTLLDILKHTEISSAIIFVGYRSTAAKLNSQLKKMNILSCAFSSDDEEKKRLRILKDFKEGRLRVLCATDAMARGLDILDVSHIIHYDLPFDHASYIHRSGRTAHQGNTGTVITLISDEEQEKAASILSSSEPYTIDYSFNNDLSVPLKKDIQKSANAVEILIRGGKNEKLRPRDIAGALSSEIDFADIGTIEIQNQYTVVTILNHDASIAEKLNGLSVKGKKRRIEMKR